MELPQIHRPICVDFKMDCWTELNWQSFPRHYTLFLTLALSSSTNKRTHTHTHTHTAVVNRNSLHSKLNAVHFIGVCRCNGDSLKSLNLEMQVTKNLILFVTSSSKLNNIICVPHKIKIVGYVRSNITSWNECYMTDSCKDIFIPLVFRSNTWCKTVQLKMLSSEAAESDERLRARQQIWLKEIETTCRTQLLLRQFTGRLNYSLVTNTEATYVTFM
jgi:hypothetical protein